MATIINPIGVKLGLTSIIVITAPTGSTVTLTTPSGTIKTTTESSGTWTFNNLTEIGTYTASATLSSQSTSSSVLVDAIGLYNVTLTYATYLYNYGDECTALTGGWVETYGSNATSSTRTKNTDNLYAVGPNSYSNNWSGWATTNVINTDNFTTLNITWSYTSESSWMPGVSSATAVGLITSAYIVDSITDTTYTPNLHTSTFDLSIFALNGKHLFIETLWYQRTYNVYAVWLE